jgi:hypothetical protein
MTNIIKERDKLYKQSTLLRAEARRVDNYNKSMELRSKQDDVYKKYQFYSNIIKANEKILRDK